MTKRFQINTSQIRQLLNQAFDDSGLDAFCQDYFYNVYNQFGRGMRKDEKITLLLDHCRRHGFDQLLHAIRNEYEAEDPKRDELKALIQALEQIVITQADQDEIEKPTSLEVVSEVTPNTDVVEKLPLLVKLLATSYNIMELADLARSLSLYVSALPLEKPGMAREIVLFAYQQGRLKELIMRLKIDGKIE